MVVGEEAKTEGEFDSGGSGVKEGIGAWGGWDVDESRDPDLVPGSPPISRQGAAKNQRNVDPYVVVFFGHNYGMFLGNSGIDSDI